MFANVTKQGALFHSIPSDFLNRILTKLKDAPASHLLINLLPTPITETPHKHAGQKNLSSNDTWQLTLSYINFVNQLMGLDYKAITSFIICTLNQLRFYFD